MKINCLSCGHKVDLDEVYDDYEGQVKCLVCGASLAIKTEEGHLKRATIMNPEPHSLVKEDSTPAA